MAVPKWSTWAWVSRIGVDVVHVEPELRDRREDLVALAGEAGVDEHHTVSVGDEGPIDEVGLREVDGVGDGRQFD